MDDNSTLCGGRKFLQSCTLREFLNNSEGAISEEMIVHITLSIMEVLESAHNTGILVLDVCTDNVIIFGNLKVKMSNFYASRPYRKDNKSKNDTWSVDIHPDYAPAEQFSSKGQLGPWTDIYALGVVMYEMVTGKIPDNAIERMVNDNLIEPKQINNTISKTINRIIMKALAVNPKNRYQSIEEMRNDFC